MTDTTNNNTTTNNNNNNDKDEGDEKQQSTTGDESSNSSSSKITAASDLSRKDRKIWVVTTAALPWRTGTSVNPLARALYLTRGRPNHAVTLMIPFLPIAKEQAKVFGNQPDSPRFQTPQQQEEWIRQYCSERVHCPDEAQKLNIRFYNATYNNGFGSIFATVDICALIPNEEADVCILEEPEHMNWMRVVDLPKLPDDEGAEDDDNDNNEEKEKEDKKPMTKQRLLEVARLGWAAKFTHVVGIIHTNYDAYVRHYGMGAAFLAASALHALSAMVTRAYCHKVIRLSDTLPSLDKTKEVTCNVHGVRSEFLQTSSSSSQPNNEEESKEKESLSAIYFIGKLIWAKGFEKMLDIEELYKKKTGSYFAIDIYGSGPDERPIQRAFFGRKGILDTSPKDAITATTAAAGGGGGGTAAGDSTPDRTAKGFFETAGSLRDQLFGRTTTAVDKRTTTPKPSTELVTSPPRSPSPEPEPIEVIWDETSMTVSSPTIMEQDETLGNGEETQIVANNKADVLPETEFPNPFVILSDLSGQFMGCGSLATMAGAKVGSDIVGMGVNAISSNGSTTSESSSAGGEDQSTLAGEEDDDEDVEEAEAKAASTLQTLAKETEKKENDHNHNDDVDMDDDKKEESGATDETTKDVPPSNEKESNDDNKEATTKSKKQHKKHKRRSKNSGNDGGGTTSKRSGIRFDPPKSRYELRRYPAPARFLGMEDHAVLRDLTQHKIFFNPSESEVLCTTSAEALAMGKFVILPKHPSNTFFESFSNCLVYESKQDCVTQIQWALEHDPKPLSEEERFQLTWEGANERLYKAAAMTEEEVQDWVVSGRAQSDRDAAKLHYETVKRGRGVQKLLHRSS